VTVIAPSDSDSAKVDAFSTSRLPRPLIVLTVYRANDVYRHRFTAGHELGHLVLHGDVASGDPQQEREADAFAAEFLTPRESIARELPLRVDFSKLVRLQKTWGVSVKSLLRRCRELGLISESSATRAYQRLNLLDGQPGFSREPISGFVGEQPALLSRAFELAAEAGLTETSLARELAWTPYRIREILGTVEKRPDLRLIVGSGLSEDADIYVDAGARLSHRDRRRSSSPGILASVDPLESEDGPLLTRPGVAQRSVEGPFRPSDL